MRVRFSRFVVAALLALALGAHPAAACIQSDDYEGTPLIDYDCSTWGIVWSVDTWSFTDLGGGQISVDASPATFPTLMGTIDCADSTFFVSTFLSGLCLESYTLSGKFTSGTTWTGMFSAWYGGYCTECAAQDYPVEGSTGTVSVAALAPVGLMLRAEQNPVRDAAVVSLSLARAGAVSVEVLDVAGRRVGLLHEGTLGEGVHPFRWDRSTAGGRAPAGVYLVRARAGGEVRVARVIAID